MIIFGTRGVNSTMESGVFNCPQCESEEDYDYKKVTRFFTLYFIPLIPMGKIGEFVECQNCKSTFVPNVLDYESDRGESQFMSEYEKALKHALILIMLADGVIDDREKEIVLDTINKHSHNDLTMGQLNLYIEDVEEQPEKVDVYLQKVAPMLNGHGKEDLIRSALAVAAADGHVDESEIQILKEMAKALDMTPAHLKGILSEIEDNRNSFSAN